jgi:hypothetical protein
MDKYSTVGVTGFGNIQGSDCGLEYILLYRRFFFSFEYRVSIFHLMRRRRRNGKQLRPKVFIFALGMIVIFP